MIHLTNKSGASVMLTERGAGIVSIVVPDRNGVMGDVVLDTATRKATSPTVPAPARYPAASPTA